MRTAPSKPWWRMTGVRGARLVAVLVLVSAAVTAIAFAAPTRSAATKATGTTLVFDRSSDLFGFDPVVDGDQTSISTMLQVYDRLVEVSQDGKQIIPGLATSWKSSNGGLALTFTLRKGVKFSDGSPVTAADVVFSLTRGTNPKTPYGVLFGNAVKKIAAVDAESSRTPTTGALISPPSTRSSSEMSRMRTRVSFNSSPERPTRLTPSRRTRCQH